MYTPVWEHYVETQGHEKHEIQDVDYLRGRNWEDFGENIQVDSTAGLASGFRNVYFIFTLCNLILHDVYFGFLSLRCGFLFVLWTLYTHTLSSRLFCGICCPPPVLLIYPFPEVATF